MDDDEGALYSADDLDGFVAAFLLFVRGVVSEPPEGETAADWAEARVGRRAFAEAKAEVGQMSPEERGAVLRHAGVMPFDG